jgi:hypothetical protein
MVHKKYYMYVLTGLLGRKFHKYSKNGLKTFHTISESSKNLITVSREMTIQFLKLYREGWATEGILRQPFRATRTSGSNQRKWTLTGFILRESYKSTNKGTGRHVLRPSKETL